MATKGEILKQLILNKGFGLGEFADKIGIARPTLSRFINNQKDWGKINDSRLAEGLGLSLTYFNYLLRLDIPLEDFARLQKLAAQRNPFFLDLIDSILRMGEPEHEGEIAPEELSFLSHHIAKIIKPLKSKD